MKNIFKNIYIFIFIGGISLLLSDPYKPLNIDFLKEKSKQPLKIKKQISESKKGDSNLFENIIKDFEKIEGLFTFYKNNKNEIYLELSPDQFEILYINHFIVY